MTRNFKFAGTGHPKTLKPLIGSHVTQDYESLTYGVAKTTLGNILVASSDKGVAAVLIGGSARIVVDDLRTHFPKAHLIRDDRGT